MGLPPTGTIASVAALHHPALTDKNGSRRPPPDRHHNPRTGQRVGPQQVREPCPIQSRPLAATAQPLVPCVPRVILQRGQASGGTICPEVVVMAPKTTAHRDVLHPP